MGGLLTMRYGVCVLLLLALPGLVDADDFVCGDATQMTRYQPSIDPSRVTDPTCFQIPKAETPAQRQLVSTVPSYYLKVDMTTHLAIEKTQAEKDQVDQQRAAAAAVEQSYRDERAQNDLCNTTLLAEIDTRVDQRRQQIQTNIDTATNITQIKQVLTQLNQQIATSFQQTLRCLVALR